MLFLDPARVAQPGCETGIFGGTLYEQTDSEDIPQAAIDASLGCGVPTAVADLHEGETVFDQDIPLPDATVDVVISNCVIFVLGAPYGLTRQTPTW